LSCSIKNHIELCEALDIADFDIAGETTGNGFYFLKGDLALLNQALIQYAIELLIKRGYTYIEPPLMVRMPILEAAMDLEGIKQSVYEIKEDKNADASQLALIGTAEHALLGLRARRAGLGRGR